jgi:hypothetical protein
MAQSIEIERFLQWVYRSELPKRATFGPRALQSAWRSIERYSQLGCRVDAGYSTQEWSAPHGDALIVAEEVANLRTRVAVDWPRSKHFLLGDLTAVAPNLDLAVSFDEVELIESYARQAVTPDWFRNQPTPRATIGKNGKPQILGTRHGKDRYSEGTHCPLIWGNPTVEGIAVARATYTVWWRSLDRLAKSLNEKLKQHVVTRPALPVAPWALA